MKKNQYELIELKPSIHYPRDVIGGKAYNLQYLIKEGLLVPKTFVLTTEDVKSLLKEDHVPNSIFDDVLDDRSYAVRSSGVLEDGDKYSYAGMLSSYLNVPRDEIISNVLRCAESVNNNRLLSYEKSLGINNKQGLAVIIQEMISPEIAGICFTMHPITNETNKIVIEFGVGLGEDVVNGNISPVLVILDKLTGNVVEINKGQYIDFKLNNFGEIFSQIHRNCLLIDNLYKKPMDIEWAISKGTIYILQSRPITNAVHV